MSDDVRADPHRLHNAGDQRRRLVQLGRPPNQWQNFSAAAHTYSARPAQDNQNIGMPATMQGMSPYTNPGTPYAQQQGYMGHYAMSQAPPQMGLVSSPFPFAHNYPQPGLLSPDPSLSAQNPYSSPPHMQHVYQFQRHPSDPGGAHPYPGTPVQLRQSPPDGSPSSSTLSGPSKSAAPPTSPVYSPPAPYYPTISAPPFAYSIPGYAPSPVYQTPQYATTYAPAYAGTEQEGSNPWWYMQHAPQAMRSGFQGHYPGNFTPAGGGREGEYFAPHDNPYHMSPLQQALPPPSPSPASAGLSSRRGPSTPLSPSRGIASPSPISPAGSLSAAGRPSAPSVRRAYHPASPSHRSEWVMWVGNVPSDATHDELWRFFTQAGGTVPGSDAPLGAGVQSIFLIARSSCAFVNFAGEAALHAAIAFFDGKPVRPGDPRCPRLVCRVRRKEDDLKAGVGAQRGTGLHLRHLRDKQPAEPEEPPPATPSSVGSVQGASALDGWHGRQRPPKHGSSGSASFASTNSSVLARHFPQRYFILKSLTQYDLDLSVERGVWATQKHNEDVLDKAYRTSKEVFLIFGVNKSGEFYGYAKMAGPIHGDNRTSWASGTEVSSTSSKRTGLSEPMPDGGSPLPSHARGGLYFSPGEYRLIEESPLPLSPAVNPMTATPDPSTERETSKLGLFVSSQPPPKSPALAEAARNTLSAPADLGRPHHTFTSSSAGSGVPERIRATASTLLSTPESTIELDEEAPIRALRKKHAQSQGSSVPSKLKETLHSVSEENEAPDADGVVRRDHQPPPDTTETDGDGVPGRQTEAHPWGGSFKIEWIRTERLPFWRTRHIRNPWNQDREVKVSRDGTELEPGVGQQLLAEWDRKDPPTEPATMRLRRTPGGKLTPSMADGMPSTPNSAEEAGAPPSLPS